MIRHTKLLITLCLLCQFFVSSCKKTPHAKTTCTSTLYGYTTPIANIFDTASTCNYGAINPSTALFSGLGTFTHQLYSNQGVYNTSDFCYYVFKTPMGISDGVGILYKINSSGILTTLSPTVTGRYESLTYNPITNRLYCIANGNIGEISIAGSSFSVSYIATPVHPFWVYYNYLPVSITVDITTGDMYYNTGDTVMFIEKYHPGVSSPTVVATVTGFFHLMGMRFNKNDNMLYATSSNSSGLNYFIKINPSTGVVTTLSSLIYYINPELSSFCFDACSNRYIYSTLHNPWFSGSANYADHVQLTVSGSVAQHDTSSFVYQGLSSN